MMRGVGVLVFVVQVLFIRRTLCSYDYVIVGGGNGGLVVASRLSEDPNVNVLVLEAGPQVEDLPEVYVPGLVGSGQAFTSLNWAYQTVPQKNMNGRNLVVNAGKALGGSTIINSMIMTRATKAQYDALAVLNNATSWDWDAVLPYFKRSEIFTPPNINQTASGASYDASVHETSTGNPNEGKVKIGFPNFFFPQSEMFVQALTNKQTNSDLEFQRAQDLSNGDIRQRVGIASDSLDAFSNTRCSAVCGYIAPFLHSRPNLDIITQATVSRILWDEAKEGELLVAKSVEYYVEGGGAPRIADVNTSTGGEVILAAGTIGTPKVMELSGVGNATLLNNLGIKVHLTLPSVGENLADHIHSWANAVTNAPINKDVLKSNETFAKEQMDLWNKNRTGFYSAAPRTLGLAPASDLLLKDVIANLINDAKRDLDRYAIEFANGNYRLQQGIKAQHQIALDLYERDQQLPIEFNVEPGYAGPTPFAALGGKNFTTVSAIFYSPLSRGRTHVASKDHNVPPAVNPAYWSHPIDVAMLVAGLQTARKVLMTPPLDSIYTEEFEPGATVGSSDERVESYLKATAASDNHETGSMAMLPRSMGGVVDTELKVYGVRNVRVADASVIPMPISAHLASTVYMIGEKAADFIKHDRQRKNLDTSFPYQMYFNFL